MLSTAPGSVAVVMVSGAACTVRVVLPVNPPEVALMVVLPDATPAASPLLALTVAAAVLEELHVAWEVRFCVLPSEYVPVATNCWLAPVAILALAGVTATELSVGGGPLALKSTSTQ